VAVRIALRGLFALLTRASPLQSTASEILAELPPIRSPRPSEEPSLGRALSGHDRYPHLEVSAAVTSPPWRSDPLILRSAPRSGGSIPALRVAHLCEAHNRSHPALQTNGRPSDHHDADCFVRTSVRDWGI